MTYKERRRYDAHTHRTGISTVIDLDTLARLPGTLCEVTDTSGKLLFTGAFVSLSPSQRLLTLGPHRRGTHEVLPLPKEFRIDVVVRIALSGNQGRIVLLFGTVSHTSPEEWQVEVSDSISQNENRESFRLSVKLNAMVQREGEAPQHCQVVDISSTGIAVRGSFSFAVNDSIVVAGVRLIEKGTIYSFRCRVRRMQLPKLGEEMLFTYGCIFTDMDSREEERLSRDIFMVQSYRLRRQ